MNWLPPLCLVEAAAFHKNTLYTDHTACADGRAPLILCCLVLVYKDQQNWQECVTCCAQFQTAFFVGVLTDAVLPKVLTDLAMCGCCEGLLRNQRYDTSRTNCKVKDCCMLVCCPDCLQLSDDFHLSTSVNIHRKQALQLEATPATAGRKACTSFVACVNSVPAGDDNPVCSSLPAAVLLVQQKQDQHNVYLDGLCYLDHTG